MLLSLVSSLVALVSPVPAAQQPPPPDHRLPEVRGGTGATPIERFVHVTYDVQLERVTSRRTSSPGSIALGNPPCYDNSEIKLPEDPQYVVANPGEDLLNWGSKRCFGTSRLRSLTIAYRSEADDVSIGGPGATFSIALYQDAAGFGVPGTEVFRRTFTGQPSNGAPASPTVQYEYNGQPFWTGPAPLVFFTIDFGTEPLPLSEGAIGWSFLQLDGDTGPVLVTAPHPIIGTLDAMDIYSPGPAVAATYVGTFNYGGCSAAPQPPCANMFVQLVEIDASEEARTTVLNGSGVNPNVLSEILPARVGHIWAARIAVVAPPWPNPPFTLLFTSTAAIGPISTIYGEVLIDPALQISAPVLAEGSYTFAIPADTALVGRRIFVQGAVLPPASPAPFLTNALRIRVGY